jgi:cysteine desulfuration protein SufE
VQAAGLWPSPGYRSLLYIVIREFAAATEPCAAKPEPEPMTIDDIIENFSLLEDWDDRYRYVIELGREMPSLGKGAHNDANKVQGCASQVWLATSVAPNGAAGPVLTFLGDSDAHIVRGLIAILLIAYSGKHAKDILSTDAVALFERLGLREHLTPQRSNGFRAMVERIKRDAQAALATA